jgi:hypothetical protein
LILDGKTVLEDAFVNPTITHKAKSNILSCYVIIMQHRNFFVQENSREEEFFSTILEHIIKKEDQSFSFMCTTIFVNYLRVSRPLPSFFYQEIDLMKIFWQSFLEFKEEKVQSLFLESVFLLKSTSKYPNEIENYLKQNNFCQHIVNLVVNQKKFISFFIFFIFCFLYFIFK